MRDLSHSTWVIPLPNLYSRWSLIVILGSMKRMIATIVIGCFVLTLNLSTATAAVKPGTTCKKLGQISTSAGIKYTCIKSGKKYVWSKGVKVVTSTGKPTPTPASTSNKAPVVWRFDGKEWISQGSVPQCPSPLIPTGELLDFSKVLSIVQPGQIRGGSYKPHAGLRWSELQTTANRYVVSTPDLLPNQLRV